MRAGLFSIFAHRHILFLKFMKKWKDYTRQEKSMMIVLFVLLIVVLLSWGRVHDGVQKGMTIFYGSPADTSQINK